MTKYTTIDPGTIYTTYTPILDRATGFALTQSLANVTQERAFTIWDGAAYHPATQDDLDIYWYDLDALGAAVIEEFRPAAIGDGMNGRPDYADPDDPGEGDGTGLGDRDSEGDDPDDPSYRASDALTLCIAALTAAQRGVFATSAPLPIIARALAAAHAELAEAERIKALALCQPVPICRWCGGFHNIQKCLDLLAEAEITPVRLQWCERERVLDYSLIAA